MNRKGQMTFILILIIIIGALVYINYFGGDSKAKDLGNKIKKLSCPDVNTNISCDYGIHLYTDNRGCANAECKASNITDTTLSEHTLQVFFIDVGQGDGIYIETPQEKHILIDCGKGDEVSDFLTFRGVNKIDWLITTHPDADHIGGCDEVFSNFVVTNFMRPNLSCTTDTCEALERVAKEEEGLNEVYGYSGYDLSDDLDLNWEILNPNKDFVFKDKNDYSIVTKLVYGKTSFLFTGDCETDCEEMMVRLDKNVSADILKVGHHGSSSSSSATFLKAVNPAFAVLSYGVNNPYGHPTQEVLDRLIAMNVKIVRTASAGTIEARTDGTQLEWHCEKKADCFN